MSTWMPLLGTSLAIRMDALDEKTALRNHGQTLEALANRGGLSPHEALLAARKSGYRDVRNGDSLELLETLANLKPL